MSSLFSSHFPEFRQAEEVTLVLAQNFYTFLPSWPLFLKKTHFTDIRGQMHIWPLIIPKKYICYRYITEDTCLPLAICIVFVIKHHDLTLGILWLWSVLDLAFYKTQHMVLKIYLRTLHLLNKRSITEVRLAQILL